MSHLTPITPACSTIRLRIYGDSGKGPVTTLPKGSIIATYALFPTGYNVKQNSPILAGIPDGWSMPNGFNNFAPMLRSEEQTDTNIRMKMTFVPMVLADDLCVRKHHMQANWTEVHASAVLSGVAELFGKFCDGRGCNSGLPGVMFPAGSEIFSYVELQNTTLHVKLCASPSVAFSRACRKSTEEYTTKIGEFVHSPLKLSFDDRDQVPSVYVDALGARSMTQNALYQSLYLPVTLVGAETIHIFNRANGTNFTLLPLIREFETNPDTWVDGKEKVRRFLQTLVENNPSVFNNKAAIITKLNEFDLAAGPIAAAERFVNYTKLTTNVLNVMKEGLKKNWILQENVDDTLKQVLFKGKSVEYVGNGDFRFQEGHGTKFVV